MRKNPLCRMFALLCLILLPASLMAFPGDVIHTFQGGSNGQYPIGLIMDSAGNLFGAAQNDASGDLDLIYELSPSGSGWNYQVLYQFPTEVASVSQLLLDSSGNLYGTTFLGGTNNLGAVFELTNNAGTWTANTLYSFGGYPTDGTNPYGGLIFDSTGNLYGTSENGGSFGQGSVFELSPNRSGGWVESLLYQFQGKPDGANPTSTLAFDASGNLFGTTAYGGLSENYCIIGNVDGCGTLFELTLGAGGWTETVLHQFGANGADGHWPVNPVTLDSHGNVFGTTTGGGGDNANGIAYAFSTGTNGAWTEHILATFNLRNGLGIYPTTGLLLDAHENLYGANLLDGPNGWGNIYILRRNGQKFSPAVLYSFTGGPDGAEPYGLAFDATRTNLYGASSYGGNANGASGDGTIFTGHITAK